MNLVTRTFAFEAAHRLLDYPGKCRHVHGHSYKATVAVFADADLVGEREVTTDTSNAWVDARGMVMDFADLKGTVGKWIDDNWDHNLILNPEDPLLEVARLVLVPDLFMGKAPYVMPGYHPNPTAENMTLELYRAAEALLRPLGIVVREVTIRETDACSAVYEPYG